MDIAANLQITNASAILVGQVQIVVLTVDVIIIRHVSMDLENVMNVIT